MEARQLASGAVRRRPQRIAPSAAVPAVPLAVLLAAVLVLAPALTGIPSWAPAAAPPADESGAQGDDAAGRDSPGEHAGAGPALGPLVSGARSLVGGTAVWTDYVYDDRGAGDDAYETAPGNLADLVQVQVSVERSDVRLRVVLQTLLDPAVPLVGFGVDADADEETGAPGIPGGAWEPRGPLGLERFVVVGHEGAEVLGWDGGSWRHLADHEARVDPGDNVLDAAVPARALGVRGREVRVVALAGAVEDGRSWLDGSRPVFDLAFVGGEEPTGWQSEKQAGILAGERPSADAVATLDLPTMRRGGTRLADATAPGVHTLLYRSALDLGEGIRTFTITAPGGRPVPVGDLYAGPYQPYTVWVPDGLPEHPPLLVWMHGFGGTHTGNLGAFRDGRSDVPAVVVSPLGRSEQSFYIGEAEQDVLDVVDDAAARYDADPDRVVLSGVSMGGFGTFRLAVRYPDRWSSAVPFIGTGMSAQQQLSPLPPEVLELLFDPERFPGGSSELLENVRNLPVRMINGQLDPIVADTHVEQDAQRLDELGYDFRSWVLLRRHHEVVPEVSSCVLARAAARARDVDPARVTYSVEPAIHMEDPSTGLELRYGGAYWVSGLEAAAEVDGPGEKGTIDAVSLARPDREPLATRVVDAGENVARGADLCGPAPEVRTGDAWRMRGMRREAAPAPVPVANGLELTLERLVEATLDLPRASIDVSEPVTLHVSGDRPATLVLRGPWEGPVAVTRDGEPLATLRPGDGAVVLRDDFAGDHTYVLVP